MRTSASRTDAEQTTAIRMRSRVLLAALAVVVGVHKTLLASLPTNDDFMHRAYARQLLAGEWPLRDFFDYGMGLMYVLSALMEQAVGHRLLAEALLIGAAAGISTWLIGIVVLRETGSVAIALLAAALALLAGPRGFSYPKLIVYAVATLLWWSYVRRPQQRTAIALGAWTAVAYYWRPDHGVYVAIGVVFAMVAAHPPLPALRRCALAGSVAAALVLPFWIFAATQVGFTAYVRSGITAAAAQHSVSQAPPRWPLRRPGDFFRIDPADAFAPRIALRWTAQSSAAERDALLARYDITVESAEDAQTQRVRLSAVAVSGLRNLISSPHIDDTSGVDRGSATLPWSTWPVWDRWRFSHAWVRLHPFPGVDEHTRAGAVAQVLLYAIPVTAICVAVIPLTRRFVPDQISHRHLIAFGLFAIVVNVGLIRTPYEVRANDAIVMPAVLFGICLAVVWRLWSMTTGHARWLAAAGAITLTALLFKSIAVAGEFRSGIEWLTGDWRSVDRAAGAWREIGDRLLASPPDRYRRGGRQPLAARLSEYARACVPSSERILVLWFAPEIYYYADRRMGGRHLHFTPAFRTLAGESRLELEKVRRVAPVLAFASTEFEAATREAFPTLMAHVDDAYTEAAAFDHDGTRYRVLARRDLTPSREYGEQGWPCYQ